MQKSECTCEVCTKACKSGNPGWFLPGEAEKTATLMGMSFEDFKKEYLVFDFWVGLEQYDVLTPLKAIEHHPIPIREDTSDGARNIIRDMESRNRGIPGKRVSWGYGMLSGKCIFLDKNDRCRIHKEKPHECAIMNHADDGIKNVRKGIALKWAKHYRNLERRRDDEKIKS